jgi:5-methylcytosine-specific restriction enzyme subunit McrC
MAALFEAFVRNFYRKEQTAYRVQSETIEWALATEGADDHYLPSMITDTSLEARDGSRKVVIDTKFYSEALKAHHDKERAMSANLYQIYAYLKNLEPRGGMDQHAEGVLLYPATGQSLDLHFHLPGHRVRICTVNLDQDWTQIHEDLIALIQE